MWAVNWAGQSAGAKVDSLECARVARTAARLVALTVVLTVVYWADWKVATTAPLWAALTVEQKAAYLVGSMVASSVAWTVAHWAHPSADQLADGRAA